MHDFKERITREIMDNIPPEIYTRVFVPKNGEMFSIEDRIYYRVVVSKVLVDLDMFGGQEFDIPLHNIPYKQTSNALVYAIPLEDSGGKHILNPIAITLPEDMAGEGGLYGAVYGPEATMTTNVFLTGVNTIEVRDNISRMGTFLKCLVGNEPNLSNWESASIHYASELALYAARAICYNELRIPLGDGGVNGGSVNSRLAEALDEMSDANTLYRELMREKMRRITLLQDKKRRRRATIAVLPTLF